MTLRNIFDVNGVNVAKHWHVAGRGICYLWLPCYLAPEGVARYCFHPVCLCVYVCMSVCLSVCLCVCVCVCPADMLAFYLSAISRDIDLNVIQDTYMAVLNSLKKIPSQVNGQGHRDGILLFEGIVILQNWAIEFIYLFVLRHLLGYSIRWNNKN